MSSKAEWLHAAKPRVLFHVASQAHLVLYCLVGSHLGLINKAALRDLQFPDVLLLLQVSFAGLVVVTGRCLAGKRPFNHFEVIVVKDYIPVVAIFFLLLRVNFRILQAAPFHFFLVLKAATCIPFALADFFFLGKKVPDVRSGMSLFGLTIGALLYSANILRSPETKKALTSSEVHRASLLFMLASVAEGIIAKDAIGKHKMDNWSRVALVNTLSMPVAFILASWSVQRPNISFEKANITETKTIAVILLSCAMGLLMSYATMTLRQMYSPTVVAVVGTANKFLSLLSAHFIFREPITRVSSLGCIIALVSAAFFTRSPERKPSKNVPVADERGMKRVFSLDPKSKIRSLRHTSFLVVTGLLVLCSLDEFSVHSVMDSPHKGSPNTYLLGSERGATVAVHEGKQLSPAKKELMVTYCAHSGYTNQMYGLLTAVDLATELGRLSGVKIKLLVPPLLLTKTIGAKCNEANTWCKTCRTVATLNESMSWGDVLDLSTFEGEFLSIRDGYNISSVSHGTSPGAQFAMENHDGAKLYLCQLTRTCGVKISLSEHINQSCAPTDFSKGSQEIHISCLGHYIFSHPQEHYITEVAFGSTYGLVPETMKRSRALGQLRLASHLVHAANRVAEDVFAGARDTFWCAHLRVGFSSWDKKPEPQFMARWKQTISAFDSWSESNAQGPGLILTDNLNMVVRDSKTCGETSKKQGCRFDEHLSEENPTLRNLSSRQQLSVFQLTCAHASKLFLTTASSFSEFIGHLHMHSPLVFHVNDDNMNERVTFSNVRNKEDIFG